MNLPENISRVAPGPEEPLTLGIDPQTLLALEDLQARYGNFVTVRTSGSRDACFINDADYIRRLLVKRHGVYRKGPGFERVKMLLGNGLIVSDGQVWRRSRRMIQPAFSRQNLHNLIEVMTDCTSNKANDWASVAQSSGTLNITREMNEFALELILRCIFGLDYERRIMAGGDNPFAFLSKDSARDLRIVMQVRESRELILEIIAERRKEQHSTCFDFLSMYLTATDKEGRYFTDKELLDELITLIVAGYETSAGTLNWAWYLLATHPDAEAVLLAEARAQLGDNTVPEHESLSAMHFTQQLLEETLRLYPPVWLFTRRAEEADTFGNFDIAAGTDIYLSPYILHRTEKYWPDPGRFDPQRFAEHEGAYKKGARPYFPFSLGPRRCLGEYFSFLEMKVHLGLLIQKFHMTLADESIPELDLGINLRTLNNIRLRPELRQRD